MSRSNSRHSQRESWALPIGARPDGDGVRFCVWAGNAQSVEVVLYDGERPGESYALDPAGDGSFSGQVAGIGAGARYMYRLDGGEPRPDPAARFQPAGVHGPSQVVDPAFAWADGGWRGLPLEDLVIYELHVGAATPAGTFDALVGRLDDLRALGVTAIELMPVADFPGERGWGYDGVCLFAPARAYGGPEGLRRLVDAAHARGLAVILDVVYNHLGPDGNYLRQFSQSYFTDRHQTPWGDALNFDGPGSRPVRDFFAANACYWAHEYHLDGLRLDATHAILDASPTHILAEIAARVHDSLPPERHFVLIAESENNDPNLIRGQGTGDRGQDAMDAGAQAPSPKPQAPGLGLDAVWADDFHHQMRVALTGEREGYYMDYSGSAEDLAATLRQGWFYTGQPSAFLGRARGAPASDLPVPCFVHCIQNHDQVGNRALGERLSQDVGLAAYRAASALLLLSPYTPLIWMGQEWAAGTPFLFFTDHHAELGRLVTAGRRAEFAGFSAFAGEQVPDPQAIETFLRSKLRWEERAQPPHAGVLQLYCDLLRLRASMPALRQRGRATFAVTPVGPTALALRRTGPAIEDTLLVVVSLRGALWLDLGGRSETAAPGGLRWSPMLDSEDARYGGGGPARLSDDRRILELEGPGAVVLSVGR